MEINSDEIRISDGSYTGIAYGWGLMDAPIQFDAKLLDKDIQVGSKPIDGVSPSRYAGIDCSGFVGHCIGINFDKVGGGHLRDTAITDSIRWNDVVKGDILINSDHVALVVDRNGDTASVIESAVHYGLSGMRVMGHTYSRRGEVIYRDNYSQGYNPRRFSPPIIEKVTIKLENSGKILYQAEWAQHTTNENLRTLIKTPDEQIIPVNVGDVVLFELEFSKAMYDKFGIVATFGPTYPYNQYEISPYDNGRGGWDLPFWISGTATYKKWIGRCKIPDDLFQGDNCSILRVSVRAKSVTDCELDSDPETIAKRTEGGGWSEYSPGYDNQHRFSVSYSTVNRNKPIVRKVSIVQGYITKYDAYWEDEAKIFRKEFDNPLSFFSDAIITIELNEVAHEDPYVSMDGENLCITASGSLDSARKKWTGALSKDQIQSLGVGQCFLGISVNQANIDLELNIVSDPDQPVIPPLSEPGKPIHIDQLNYYNHSEQGIGFFWEPAYGFVHHYNVYVNDSKEPYGMTTIAPTKDSPYYVKGESFKLYYIQVEAEDAQGNKGPISKASFPAIAANLIRFDHIQSEWQPTKEDQEKDKYRFEDKSDYCFFKFAFGDLPKDLKMVVFKGENKEPFYVIFFERHWEKEPKSIFYVKDIRKPIVNDPEKTIAIDNGSEKAVLKILLPDNYRINAIPGSGNWWRVELEPDSSPKTWNALYVVGLRSSSMPPIELIESSNTVGVHISEY